MKVLGIDFTSRPSRRKTITCLHGSLDGKILRAGKLEAWTSYAAFEEALAQPGPWIAGLDFPFGQARRFIETIGWPRDWPGYVAHAGSLGRDGFRSTLNAYRAERPEGDKEHRRAADKAAGSISPQKLYGVPVGMMFFEGAPRLLASSVTIPHLKEGDPKRIVVEAYPGVLARALVGRRSYKTDTTSKRTADQRAVRLDILQQLEKQAPRLYGFGVEADSHLCDDPGADHLDALLCAVQAAWSWAQRESGYGAPDSIDAREGWIADPHVRSTAGASGKEDDMARAI